MFSYENVKNANLPLLLTIDRELSINGLKYVKSNCTLIHYQWSAAADNLLI